ncbi:Rrp1 protein [Saccharomycopsis crataegensis]|uniref:Rrp1 protein n=1 Tax=Saccharomycopsis crataegensis TaxID=43959 RepID=A0AAV5QEM8_9ASCO|nr:Rrp1 protein [Saccharomycopsis crataegensis]
MSETTFVKKLASNERPVRESAIEALKQYLSRDKKLSLLKYQKLWKGLYYSMWFSDRPRPQQRLAMVLGKLFSETIPLNSFTVFVEAFWSLIIREWPQIDRHRIDKFYLLLRRVIGCCFERLKKEDWDVELVNSYVETLQKNVLSGQVKIPLSLTFHIIDVYIDELEKVMFEDINDEELANEDLDEEEKEKLMKEINEQKKEILEEVPLDELFKVFGKLKQSTGIKVLKAKIDEDLIADERIQEWKIKVEDDSDNEEEEDDEEGEEDEESDEEYFQ